MQYGDSLTGIFNYTMLYTKSGRQDSNLRPSGPKPDALPGCATPRFLCYLTEISVVCKFTRENFESSCGIG